MEHGKQDGVSHARPSGPGGIKNLLMMLVCCLAPLGFVLLLRQIGYTGAAGYLILLLCPLMHLFMMRRMGHKQQKNIAEKKQAVNE